MICKCKEDMHMLMGDEYAELYFCEKCRLYALKNIECIEEKKYLKEVE